LEPQTIQFVGRAAELMMGCMHMEKHTDPGNPVVSIQIGDVLVSNVLIDLGAAINVMSKQTMDQIGLVHIRPTPIVLELADRSKIKMEGVLDDVVISLDSWKYPIDFIVLQPKNLVGGNPLILGQLWLATVDAYIRCCFGDMYISHGDSIKVTLYPPARSIQELRDTLCLDYNSDEETHPVSLIHQNVESSQEGEIQDFLNNLDTTPNFESLSQIFSLDF